VAHFTAVADASACLSCYDIPGRCGVPIATESLLQLAQHPRIVAVKDAKGDMTAASIVMTGATSSFTQAMTWSTCRGWRWVPAAS
jgi:4-hydroxy-tetrahydrodipicolinate synthase